MTGWQEGPRRRRCRAATESAVGAASSHSRRRLQVTVSSFLHGALPVRLRCKCRGAAAALCLRCVQYGGPGTYVSAKRAASRHTIRRATPNPKPGSFDHGALPVGSASTPIPNRRRPALPLPELAIFDHGALPVGAPLDMLTLTLALPLPLPLPLTLTRILTLTTFDHGALPVGAPLDVRPEAPEEREPPGVHHTVRGTYRVRYAPHARGQYSCDPAGQAALCLWYAGRQDR